MHNCYSYVIFCLVWRTTPWISRFNMLKLETKRLSIPKQGEGWGKGPKGASTGLFGVTTTTLIQGVLYTCRCMVANISIINNTKTLTSGDVVVNQLLWHLSPSSNDFDRLTWLKLVSPWQTRDVHVSKRERLRFKDEEKKNMFFTFCWINIIPIVERIIQSIINTGAGWL